MNFWRDQEPLVLDIFEHTEPLGGSLVVRKMIKETNRQKKSQSWSTDFILGLLIFVIVVLFSIKIIQNATQTKAFNNIYDGSKELSDYFMSSGFPENWTLSDVVRIGLVDNKRLNLTKYDNLSTMNYESTKIFLNTRYDYFIFFENDTSILYINSRCGYGSPKVDPAVPGGCGAISMNFDYDNLVKIERYLIYNASIIKMVLYVWR